jgi:hypothetical protein
VLAIPLCLYLASIRLPHRRYGYDLARSAQMVTTARCPRWQILSKLLVSALDPRTRQPAQNEIGVFRRLCCDPALEASGQGSRSDRHATIAAILRSLPLASRALDRCSVHLRLVFYQSSS